MKEKAVIMKGAKTYQRQIVDNEGSCIRFKRRRLHLEKAMQRPVTVAMHASTAARSQHLQTGLDAADVAEGDERLLGQSMESVLELLMIRRDVVEVGEDVGEDADECQK